MVNVKNQQAMLTKEFVTAPRCFAKTILSAVLPVFLVMAVGAQQTVIPLHSSVAPGSEVWTWQEQQFFVKAPLNANVAYNVTKPTLTVYTPDSANGTSVIICPGGGMRVLNVETEGAWIAKELNKKGITAFVFKYRLLRIFTADPWKEMLQGLQDTSLDNIKRTAEIAGMAGEDLRKAVAYVKENAASHKLDENKIGVIGFSGGANLAVRLAVDFNSETKPNFIASIYGNKPPDKNLPAGAPPIFIAVANDDQRASPAKSVELYNLWVAAKIPAELHIYARGDHGLRRAPANTWIHRFTDWLEIMGFNP